MGKAIKERKEKHCSGSSAKNSQGYSPEMHNSGGDKEPLEMEGRSGTLEEAREQNKWSATFAYYGERQNSFHTGVILEYQAGSPHSSHHFSELSGG